MRDLIPPALIAAALIAWATGALDSAGLQGAGQGLGVGALICAPIWLLSLYRRSHDRRDHRD